MTESSLEKKDLGILGDQKLAICTCSTESQLYPELNQKQQGQQDEGGDPAPQLW